MDTSQPSRTILLSKGHVAIISAEDYERVSLFKWTACEKGKTTYAVRSLWRNKKRKTEYLHRYILGATDIKTPIDHANRNGLDCRRENLRLCTQLENNRNRPKQAEYGGRRTSSSYRGVAWHEQRGKWVAGIGINKRRKHIGIFTSETEAAEAYDQAALSEFGEFANLNFPENILRG